MPPILTPFRNATNVFIFYFTVCIWNDVPFILKDDQKYTKNQGKRPNRSFQKNNLVSGVFVLEGVVFCGNFPTLFLKI